MERLSSEEVPVYEDDFESDTPDVPVVEAEAPVEEVVDQNPTYKRKPSFVNVNFTYDAKRYEDSKCLNEKRVLADQVDQLVEDSIAEAEDQVEELAEEPAEEQAEPAPAQYRR